MASFSVILLDTHVIMWLHGGRRNRIPAGVQRRLNREELGLSPFVQLELNYMYEIGRANSPAKAVIDELRPRLELTIADVGASAVCETALDLTWTRDPFDRLLAAHSIVSNLALLTSDETMRQHLALAWWTD